MRQEEAGGGRRGPEKAGGVRRRQEGAGGGRRRQEEAGRKNWRLLLQEQHGEDELNDVGANVVTLDEEVERVEKFD